MSVIVIAKDGESLVLSTDSRVMVTDFSVPLTDSEQKIYEVAPETFIATAGWLLPCHFQVETACKLARDLNTTDIRVLSEALERESLPYLEKFVELLASALNLPQVEQVLSGEKILHIGAMVGRRASGELGYVIQTFRVRNGRVMVFREQYFGSQRQMFCSVGDFNELLLQDQSIWTVSPVQVVQKFLSTLKLASRFIGGPDQIVELDRRGTRWVSPPPAPTMPTAGLAIQTALFTGTATFAYTASGPYVQVGSYGATFADNLASPTSAVTVAYGGVSIEKVGTSSSVQVTSGGVGIYGPSGSVTLTSGGVVISNGSSSVSVTPSTVVIVNGTLTLNLNGITTVIGNGYDSVQSTYVGLRVGDNSDGHYSTINARGMFSYDPTNGFKTADIGSTWNGSRWVGEMSLQAPTRNFEWGQNGISITCPASGGAGGSNLSGKTVAFSFVDNGGATRYLYFADGVLYSSI